MSLDRYYTFELWRRRFERFFKTSFKGHFRHRAIAARTEQPHLNNSVIGDVDEFHIAAIGVQKWPKLLEGI
jgi:hypothetical protein